MSAQLQRRARADLEFRLGGVDVPAMKRDAAEARRYEAAIAELHAKHGREVATLETRLAWYRDNQAILDQDRETITAQAAQKSTGNQQPRTHTVTVPDADLQSPELPLPGGDHGKL